MAGFSLKCGDCGMLLKSVEEAQEHAELTKHANFVESTEAVLNLVCSDCGKPCRSKTESDLHTKRTGHTGFVDKTSETAKPISLEAPKTMDDVEMEETGEGSSTQEEEMVVPEVNQQLLSELEEMGFPKERATRALHLSGNESLEAAANWIVEHENDPDIDEMPLVPASSKKSEAPKKALTPEEIKQKQKELRERARKKKEEEEKLKEREREKERIRVGKELLEAKRIEEDNERKRILALRKAEKEEEKRAREKIRQKLEEDKAQAMPVALSGRDLLGCAETGSGKTAAFTIPMIQHCLAQPPIRRGDGPLALVLAPTRELAQQIEKEVKAFSRSLNSFRTAIVVGGMNISEQRSELRAGVNIVVATPGRFIDHLQQGNTSLSRISYIVLDEADRMLDMGFEPQIREVMQNLPKKHQTLLFSATMPVEIEELAQEYLTNPVRVKVGKVSSPTANVSQVLEKVPENEKIDRLLDMLVEAAAQSERCGHSFPLTIVFVERKNRCDEVAEALVQQGLRAASLHGGRSQSERETALRDFRHGPTRILVATDVASRGLDVTGVAHVINLDLPKAMEDYVHRIGRTGRAGSTGQATSFYTDRDMYLVAQIKKAIQDVESGNSLTFATGKSARRKEREAIAAHKDSKLAQSKLSMVGLAAINVEEKYRHMISPAASRKEGSADNAWDD